MCGQAWSTEDSQKTAALTVSFIPLPIIARTNGCSSIDLFRNIVPRDNRLGNHGLFQCDECGRRYLTLKLWQNHKYDTKSGKIFPYLSLIPSSNTTVMLGSSYFHG